MSASESQQLGDFRILREIGRGGMGVVYEAEQVSLGRHVALKVLTRNMLLDATHKRRFEREAKAAGKLHHTNIVPVFGVGEHDGTPYLVMQFIQGMGLDDVLGELKQQRGTTVDASGSLADPAAMTTAWTHVDNTEPPPSSSESGRTTGGLSSIALPGGSSDTDSGSSKTTYWQSVAMIGVQAADALEYAHKQGILHRDIKPSNLLLDGRGVVWVTDFGLAKADDEANLTREGEILGTLRYMPPEAFEGRSDPRSDIYSLGLTLYEMLALRPAFAETNRPKLIKLVTTTDPEQLRRLNPAIPRDLATIVHKASDRDPARRYQTAGEFAADLRRFLADVPIRARRTSNWEYLTRWVRHNRGLAAALAALLLMLMLVAVVSSVSAVRFRESAARNKQLAEENEIAFHKAEHASQTERWERYRSNLAAAASALQLQNIRSARLALDAAPEEHRNWEWRHLDNQLDGSQAVLRGHTDGVRDVAWSSDGKWLASAASDRTIRLWDAATGRERALLRGHDSNVVVVAFTPDGGRLTSLSDEGTLRLWEAATGKEIARMAGPSDPQMLSIAVRPDGKQIASRAAGGVVRLWDGATGQAVAELRGHTGIVYGLAYSPDGRRLASTSEDATIRLWDTTAAVGAREVAVLQGHTGIISAVAWSRDGSRLVTGANYPDHDLRLWDMAASQPKLLAILRGHKNGCWAVCFSPDGTRIASASQDQTARLWDGRTGQPIATLMGHWNVVRRVQFSPDGRRLLTASDDGTMRLWQGTTGEPIAVLRGHTDRVMHAAFSPDGRRIASASDDRTIRLWDVGQVERNGILRGHTRYVYDVAFSPDGRRLASTGWDGTARLWDAATGRQIALLRHKENLVTSTAFSPDGKLLATVERQHGVRLWDVDAATVRHHWPVKTGYWRADSRAAFNPAGTLLASGCTDGAVREWDVASGREIAVLRGHRESSTDVVFHPNGKQLASGSVDGTVRLWDTDARRELAVLRGHTGAILRLAFSSDGALLASASDDRTVRLWDMRTHEALATLAHGSSVYGVAFSPDGTRLATGCADNTARLWDLATRQEVVELRGHDAYVHAVVFSADGTRLATASGDNTVRIWDSVSPRIRAEELAAPRHYVCSRAAGPITIDGKLDDPAWQAAPWTEDFVDIEGVLHTSPRFRTRAKMLWDDNYFYIAAELEEPHVWATLTKHDSVIFHDNDFEVFIDPDGDTRNYAEFEMNALNTGWDLLLPKPYREGGKANDNWEIPGLKTAVHVYGTLNDPRDTDRGWSVEIAIPWKVLGKLTTVPAPPREGDQWRINFSRVEWLHKIVDGKYRKVPNRREDNWVWSPQGVIDMHRPETWGYVRFSERAGGTTKNPEPRP